MKYPIVLQHNEEDCGAACLATIAKYHGRSFRINRIREAIGTGQLGTTLLGLMQGAETLGFNARSVRANSQLLDHLNEIPLPAILHWQGNHYVVLYGKQGQKYTIGDPAIGLQHLSQQDLLKDWSNGVMLLVEPDAHRFFQQENDRISGFGRFLKPIWQYRGLLIQVLLINVFVGALSLALPFLIQILTDDVLVRGDVDLLTRIIVAILLMESIGSFLDLTQYTLIAHFAQRLELNLVLDFGRHLLRLPLIYYESHRSGEIASRLKDITEINRLVSQVVVSLPSRLFIAIAALVLMLIYNIKLTIVAVVIAVLMTASTAFLLPTLRKQVRRLLMFEAENQGILVETFKGALTFKTLAATSLLWREFQTRFGQQANLAFKTMQISIFNHTFSGFISRIGEILLLGIGSGFVMRHELTIGQLLAFNVMNAYFLGFATFVVRFMNDYIRVNASVQRLSEVIDATPETTAQAREIVTLSNDAGISCQQLNFHHVGRTELLQDFSLRIPGGVVSAIVGESGSGKSTLAKLIAGLYIPQSGNIRLGTYNIQDLSIDCVRQQVVLIPQEAHFWSRSILDNFYLAAPYASFEEIVQACQIAEADEFISQLPDKYQTVLGEFGANLSGGQRQRLAIARAIVANPPILILDESTANLDASSEAKVLNSLLKQRQGNTTILISHRSQVTERAFWLIELAQGKLIRQGAPAIRIPHQDVMGNFRSGDLLGQL